MSSNMGLNFLAGSIFLAIITFLGYYPQQEDFSYLLPGFTLAFGIYYFCCKKLATQQRLTFWLGVAVVARFLLLFSFPNLSDDVYRFIWDGRLLNQGINPFEQLPGYYLLAGNEVIFLVAAIYFYVKLSLPHLGPKGSLTRKDSLSIGLPHFDPKGSPARGHTAPHEAPHLERLINGLNLKYLLLSGVAMGFAIATKFN